MNSQNPLRTSILLSALMASIFTGSALAQPTMDNVLKNLKFRSVGPATMGGRLDDVAVVESDTRVIYVGAAAGGLFKNVSHMVYYGLMRSRLILKPDGCQRTARTG